MEDCCHTIHTTDGGMNRKESEKETMMEREEASESIEENTKETQESEEMDLNELEEEQLRDDETIFETKFQQLKEKQINVRLCPNQRKKCRTVTLLRRLGLVESLTALMKFQDHIARKNLLIHSIT